MKLSPIFNSSPYVFNMSNPYAFDTDIRRGPLSVEYNISLVCSISVRKLGFEVVYLI